MPCVRRNVLGLRSCIPIARAGVHPAAVAGLRNAQWVAMDYGTVIVHLFLREVREFYDLERLWADAIITEIPNLD